MPEGPSDNEKWQKWLVHISHCDSPHCRNAQVLARALGTWMDPAKFDLVNSDTDGTHVAIEGGLRPPL